ncbi:MAG: glycosyltransferase family 2 protein [Chitinispirillaceae bacterium]|nr:glycosyltransferase family 2 protein [Chitinispirillaceae bacterium]
MPFSRDSKGCFSKDDRAVTVIVPTYNEEAAISQTVEKIWNTMVSTQREFEILVIDDGSNDGTNQILNSIEDGHLRIIRHNRNKGYGAALKTGVRAATTPLIVITDADGTYPNERIPELLSDFGGKDMLVGSRTGKKVKIPFIRKIPKWFIGRLANYLARIKIPDINSGLMVFNRDTLLGYLNILPNGFSFTTTITLAMLTCGNEVEYVAIDYAHRVGKSKIRPIRDTLNFIQLIIRTILLFEPLRIFIPIAALMFLSSIGVFVYSYIFTPKVMDMTIVILIVGSIQMLGIGMLADMINRRLGR